MRVKEKLSALIEQINDQGLHERSGEVIEVMEDWIQYMFEDNEFQMNRFTEMTDITESLGSRSTIYRAAFSAMCCWKVSTTLPLDALTTELWIEGLGFTVSDEVQELITEGLLSDSATAKSFLVKGYRDYSFQYGFVNAIKRAGSDTAKVERLVKALDDCNVIQNIQKKLDEITPDRLLHFILQYKGVKSELYIQTVSYLVDEYMFELNEFYSHNITSLEEINVDDMLTRQGTQETFKLLCESFQQLSNPEYEAVFNQASKKISDGRFFIMYALTHPMTPEWKSDKVLGQTILDGVMQAMESSETSQNVREFLVDKVEPLLKTKMAKVSKHSHSNDYTL